MPERTTSLAIILIAILIGFQAGFVFHGSSSLLEDDTTDASRGNITDLDPRVFDVNITGDGIESGQDLTYQVFRSASESVVSIMTYQQTAQGLVQQSSGSGFIVDDRGHIVTNNHVIEQGNIYDVRLNDGSVHEAEVVGTDPYTDLAVLTIDEPGLRPLALGNSSAMRQTDPVLAIGAPFGLRGTVTKGIISGTDRRIPATEGFSIPNVIQTDAAINPGNSGGPLLNLRGEVIGINTAIDTETSTFSGVGFAIPSNTVSRIVPDLIEDGDYEHPWIGVEGIDVTPPIAEEMDVEEARGFLIINVVDNSPADAAGLQGGSQDQDVRGQNITLGGDVIIGIDGTPVSNLNDVLTYLSKSTEVGETITLTVIRDGQRREVELTLAQRP